jgi:triosephosphate isomerase
MAPTRRKLIAGNWKMNKLRQDGFELALALKEMMAKAEAQSGPQPFDMLICPPFTLLDSLGALLEDQDSIQLGAQDCHVKSSGAHTGDISAAMLKDVGCSHVIVGHSERRADHHETDHLVHTKAVAAMEAGMTAIVCVGETEAQRDAGQTAEIVTSQVRGSVPVRAGHENLVVAYEPVWAIGTGKTPTVTEVQEVHAMIRTVLTQEIGAHEAGLIRILYGGSVNPKNAKELLALPDVDGGLVGGASLKPEDFWAIGQATR